MMVLKMFKVIKQFKDLQDGMHLYKVGDTYPRAGLEPSEDRIKELSTNANKQKQPLIKEVEQPKKAVKKKKAKE